MLLKCQYFKYKLTLYKIAANLFEEKKKEAKQLSDFIQIGFVNKLNNENEKPIYIALIKR